ERGAGAALTQLLKLPDHLLSFFSLTRTNQRGAEIVERGGVVRLGGHGQSKRGNRLRILFLLGGELAYVYIRADVVRIDTQDFLKLSDRFVRFVLSLRRETEQVIRLRG